jgi:hypothetical protein
MTQLRKMMLEGLERRNYAQTLGRVRVCRRVLDLELPRGQPRHPQAGPDANLVCGSICSAQPFAGAIRERHRRDNNLAILERSLFPET